MANMLMHSRRLCRSVGSVLWYNSATRLPIVACVSVHGHWVATAAVSTCTSTARNFCAASGAGADADADAGVESDDDDDSSTRWRTRGHSKRSASLTAIGAQDVSDLPTLSMPFQNRVFTNNDFDMGSIEVVGFDYDYTLANYTEQLPKLLYDLAMDYLVKRLKYPVGLQSPDICYDPNFAIRGLTYDRRTGLLMKLNSFHAISLKSVHRGKTRLSSREVFEIYGRARHVSMEYRNTHMKALVDLFSLGEANLLANVVQYFEDHNIRYTPAAVAEDANEALEYVHMSGIMHNKVLEDLPSYLMPDPDIKQVITRFRNDGKQLFLLTNSTFAYIDPGMRFLFGDDWRQLFDLVMVRADKPRFYTKTAPFRELDVERDRVWWTEVRELKPGKVYVQGSVSELLRMTGWDKVPVMYIGDSMYSDWRDPSVTHGWIIGGIIRELEEHIEAQSLPSAIRVSDELNVVDDALRRVQLVDDDTPEGRRRLVRLCEALDPRSRICEDDVSRRQVVKLLYKRRNHLHLRRQRMHNHNFGGMFTSHHSATLFAFSLLRYVDFYTSRLSNFLAYPSDYHFFPQRRRTMPHTPPMTDKTVET